MSPESRELEAFFQDVNDPPPRDLEAAGAASPADTEFDLGSEQFFRNLSSLDDLNFGFEGEEEQQGPVPSPAAEPPSAVALTAPLRAAKAPPRAGAAQGGAGKPAAAVGAKAAGPRSSVGGRSVAVEARGAARRSPWAGMLGVLKVVAIGTLLFALGLGAGWLVLSLPASLERKPPPVARQPVQSVPSALPAQKAVAPALEAPPAALATKIPPLSEAPESPADGHQSLTPEIPVRQNRVAPVSEQAGEKEHVSAGAGTPSRPAPGGESTHAPEIPPAVPDRLTAPTSGTAEAPLSAQAVGTPATVPNEARYALQVGACRSGACVEDYRKRLRAFVSPDSVRVVQSPGVGGAGFRRVRVAPLTQAAAEALKTRLSAADKAFQTAYVVVP